MKELTTEEKAERYDKALDNARHYHSEMEGTVCCVLEECFPELRESEDEKIRKAIINVFASHKDYENFYGASVEEILLWLEKQGKQKLVNDTDEDTVEAVKDNSLDTVEPKFHEGDWIVHNATGIIHQIKYPIENVTNKTYGYDLIDGGYISSNDAVNYHLWTIQDAKDGDVLIGNKDGVILIFIKKKDVVLSEIKRRLNEWRFLSSTEAKYKYEAYNDLYEWAKQL